MKTVRFTQVVARSGKPEPHTLWTRPEDDRELQSALKAHRVMTVHQARAGQKTDFGEVGYTEDRQANLLIFPKSLQTFAGKRVVGVKYELLETPAAPARPKVRPRPAAKREGPKATPPARKQPKPAELRIFQPEEEEEVPAPEPAKPSAEAATLRAAIRRALKQLQGGKAVAAYQTLERAARA